MRLERRPQASRAALVLAPIGAVVVTLLLSSLLVAWAGAPVGRAYALLLEGGFGSRFAITETLTRATPLILTGLAAAVAFRARLYNIGAEGSCMPARWPRWRWAGCTAAAASRPRLVAVPADDRRRHGRRRAAAAGAGAAEEPLGVDEVVTTLLLNFIVLLACRPCWTGR
jgi:ABC-type uncharacterized transport system permease subunit